MDMLVFEPDQIVATPPPRFQRGSTSQSEINRSARIFDNLLEQELSNRAYGAGSLYFLMRIDSPAYALMRNILLNVEEIDEGVMVSDNRLNLYGVGETVEAAVDEFTSMLLDLYEELVASEAVLAQPLRQQLAYLCTIISSL